MIRKALLSSAIALALASPSQLRSEPYRPTVNGKEIDIDKEYELIKQKKSKLSANARRWVVFEYDRKRLNEDR